MNATAIAEIESALGYVFTDKNVLVTAFTHASFANENQLESNERLEFLGDAVLGYIVARSLFRDSVYRNEGDLTKRRASLVSAMPLLKAVEQLGLLKFVRTSSKINPNEWTDKKKSDLYEAVIGAIYVDSGEEIAPCELFFHRTVFPAVPAVTAVNPISVLKEYLEKNPDLKFYKEEDAANGGFVCVLTICGQVFEGTGRTKKEAERGACKKACKFLKLI